MKKNIHPERYTIETVCSCGQKRTLVSTKNNFSTLDVCSACHPFFTGKHRFIDTAGRVEQFKKRFGALPNQFKPKL